LIEAVDYGPASTFDGNESAVIAVSQAKLLGNELRSLDRRATGKGVDPHRRRLLPPSVWRPMHQRWELLALFGDGVATTPWLMPRFRPS
jgi:hypothetical protein